MEESIEEKQQESNSIDQSPLASTPSAEESTFKLTFFPPIED